MFNLQIPTMQISVNYLYITEIEYYLSLIITNNMSSFSSVLKYLN